MASSELILIFSLGIFSAVRGACAGLTTSTACTSNTSCLWNAGSCGTLDSVDCTPGECAVGCTYTAGTPGKCEDEKAIECAAKTQESLCSNDNGCQWVEKTCEEPTNSRCVVTGGDYCYSKPGCEMTTDRYTCEPPIEIPSATVCTGSSVETVSKCEAESDGQCKIEGSKCVPISTEDQDYTEAACNELGIDLLSFCEAMTFGECKLENAKCVSVSGSAYQDGFCGSFGTEPRSDCISKQCRVVNGACVASTLDQICSRLSVAGLTMCDAMGQGTCKVQGSACVAVVVGGNSECGQFSLDPATECLFYGCNVSNGACVARSANSEVTDEKCGAYSAETETPCSQNSGHGCKVSGGVCVGNPYTCTLTQSGGDCDRESDKHGCIRKEQEKCTAQSPCASLSEDVCESEGCVLSNVGHCGTEYSSFCFSGENGECASATAGCSTTAAVAEVCHTNAGITCTGANTKTATECSAVTGCKWLPTIGGTCVEKGSGGNDEPQDDGTVAIRVPTAMAILLVLLFAIVL